MLLLLPVALWLEREHLPAWGSRLAFPPAQDEPNRHTPLISQGTFLPPTITEQVTLTAKDNPVILPAATTITKAGALTIEPGAIIMVHEYGQLIVDGRLHINGTEKEPVTFLTNESHPANQMWGGIIFNPSGNGSIAHATFEHASPAISCLNTNNIAINQVKSKYSNQDIFNPAGACKIN